MNLPRPQDDKELFKGYILVAVMIMVALISMSIYYYRMAMSERTMGEPDQRVAEQHEAIKRETERQAVLRLEAGRAAQARELLEKEETIRRQAERLAVLQQEAARQRF